MAWWELPLRGLELGLDCFRFVTRRWYRPRLGEQRFVSPFPVAKTTTLQTIWHKGAWQQQSLDELSAGIFECNGQKYQVQVTNKWIHCPSHQVNLPMHLGRLYLFSKMYAMANMQYIGTLNRHYHLVHLAKAAHLGLYPAQSVIDEMRDWIMKNPYMEGINWSDTLNFSIRVVNWCHVFSFLQIKTIPADIVCSLHQQGQFIENHLSFGSAAGNHLLGELWGLYFLGHCFPDLPRARYWRKMSNLRLMTEIRRQFSTEGLHKEASVSYHRYLMEYLLLLLILSRHLDIQLDPLLSTTIHRGLVGLSVLRNQAGEMPFFGDYGHEITTDIHYTAFWQNDLYCSVLMMGACFFRDPGLLQTVNDGPDQRLPWVVSESDLAWLANTRAASHIIRESVAYPEVGFFILRDQRPFDQETSLIVRCGSQGYGKLCAHAHADMLSFVFSIRGQQFLIDPGTYGYHFKGTKWREYFRGSCAHNTLLVEDQSQAVSGGAMIWLEKVHGVAEDWAFDRPTAKFSGRHDGFHRLTHCPIRHRREFYLDSQRHVLRIIDQLIWSPDKQAKPTDVTLYFHFHPEVEVQILDSSHLIAKRGDNTLLMHFHYQATIILFKGDEDRPLGWYSPYLGIKIPCYSACIQTTSDPLSQDSLELTLHYLPIQEEHVIDNRG